MDLLKKLTTAILYIIVFGEPQLHEVHAIKIPNEIKLNLFEDVEL